MQNLGKADLYDGCDGSGCGRQKVFRIFGNIALSVVYNYNSDKGDIAIVELTSNKQGIPHPHWPGVEFRRLRHKTIHTDHCYGYTADAIIRIKDELSSAKPEDFEIAGEYAEYYKRYWGGKDIDKIFQSVKIYGKPCVSPVSSIYSIRYEEDLCGFMPIACIFTREKHMVETWLILADSNKKLFVDHIPAGSGVRGYGIQNAVPIEDMLYPEHVFDIIFHDIANTMK